MNSELGGAFAYELRLEWADPNQSREAFLKNGKLVVKMARHEDQSRNLVTAVMQYVPRSIVPQVRSFVEQRILTAVDFTAARVLLLQTRDTAALQYFNEEYVNPAVVADSELARRCSEFEQLNDRGYFTRILLRELLQLGNKLYGRFADEQIRSETRRFADVLCNLATRKPGELRDMTVIGRKMRLAIVLVGVGRKLAASGISRHLGYIRRCLERDIEVIYVCARGDKILAARALVMALRRLKVAAAVSASQFRGLGPTGGKVLDYIARVALAPRTDAALTALEQAAAGWAGDESEMELILLGTDTEGEDSGRTEIL